MIRFNLITCIFLSSFTLQAQNTTLAKLKFESAQESFKQERYEEALKKLKEAEQLFGKSNPPISHQRIMVLDQIVSSQRHEIYYLLQLIREEAFYMKNFSEIESAAVKTKEVMDVRDRHDKRINKLQDKEKLLLLVKRVEEGRIDAICEFARVCKSLHFYDEADPWFRKCADSGDTDAMVEVFNLGYSTDESAYLLKAVEAGNARALYEYGEALYTGRRKGIPQEIPKAITMYEQAIQKGSADAPARLGDLYRSFEAGPYKDYKKAMEMYQKAIQAGNVWGYGGMARLYEKGLGVPQDYEMAREIYSAWIKTNDGVLYAFLGLGDHYKNGWGVEKDYKTALELYDKGLAKYGRQSEVYDYRAGELYFYGGYGVQQDYTKALEYFNRSDFFPQSEYFLGQFAQKGVGGVPLDYKKAMMYYKKSADDDYADAMTAIGYMYEKGLGVDKDKTEAKQWYQKAEIARSK